MEAPARAVDGVRPSMAKPTAVLDADDRQSSSALARIYGRMLALQSRIAKFAALDLASWWTANRGPFFPSRTTESGVLRNVCGWGCCPVLSPNGAISFSSSLSDTAIQQGARCVSAWI